MKKNKVNKNITKKTAGALLGWEDNFDPEPTFSDPNDITHSNLQSTVIGNQFDVDKVIDDEEPDGDYDTHPVASVLTEIGEDGLDQLVNDFQGITTAAEDETRSFLET